MEEYCEQHKTLSFCEKVNRTVPPSFCTACQGNWRQWRRYDARKYREKHRPKLTEEQLNDDRLVSVVMPARDCEKPYIQKTIDSVRENAVGPIEIVIVCDGWEGNYGDLMLHNSKVLGQRASANQGVKVSNGEFIFRLDPHSAMSPGWDARMKSSCTETCVVTPIYDHLDPETWQPTGRDAGFWMLDANLKCHSVSPWIPIQLREIEEDAMSIVGGAWMIRKKYYDELGGHDESFCRHGAVGAEWTLKVWLTGGSVLVRTDVFCAHLFRTKSPYGYDWEGRERTYKKLHKMWVLGEDPRRKKPIEWLLYKFKDYTKYPPIARVRLR